MEMRNLSRDLHVAQQSRRDKLRVQQGSNPCQYLEDYTHNFEQSSVHQGLNLDLIRFPNLKYGNITYDPSEISSEMLSFATNSQSLFLGKDETVLHHDSNVTRSHKQMVTENDCFGNVSHMISSNFHSSAKANGDTQNCSGTWKNIGSEQSCEWIVNQSSGSTAIESSQNPIFVGEGLSASLKVGNLSPCMLYTKPSYHAYQEVQSSISTPPGEIFSQNGQRQFVEAHCQSPFYDHTLQDVVSSATVGSQELELVCSRSKNVRDEGRGSWENGGNELLLLPSYDDHSNHLGRDNASALVHRSVEGCHPWGGELSTLGSKNIDTGMKAVSNDNCNTQGLSLSLSSVLPSRSQLGQLGEKYDSEDLRSRAVIFSGITDSKPLKSDYLYSKSFIGSKAFGNGQEMVGASFAHRNTGPLGPFTAYATILKSSKYFRPTQELLDDFCCVAGQNHAKICDVSHVIPDEAKASTNDVVNTAESVVGGVGIDSGSSPSGFYLSNDLSEEVGCVCWSSKTCRPEYQKKKSTLLYMQEEVCRRYKQYHQQMQIVVSSFESMASLSSATPYISLALKTISRSFSFQKNAILGQLNHVRKALGEDLSSLMTWTSSSRADTNAGRLKFVEHGYQKNKSGESNLGFLEMQHVWRPQRGLPERAVSVLRGWLFDHFLHPYPTDTDKQMLASQTGLSRNQVSNWFINARVRIWKPMVEEIHMLETKGLGESNLNAGSTVEKSTTKDTNSRPIDKQSINEQVDYAGGIGASPSRGNELCVLWSQKRSRVEGQLPMSMDGSLMSFVPYQSSGVEIGGLGSVSLTLGLRQSVESAHHQQQLYQQEHHLGQHLRGQVVHDLVN